MTMALKSSSNRSIQDDLKEISKMTKKDMIGGGIKAILDGQEMARARDKQFNDEVGFKPNER